MSDDSSRVEFEAWCRTEHPGSVRFDRNNVSGRYLYTCTADMWEGWQAGRASKVAAGYKLVPAEPT